MARKQDEFTVNEPVVQAPTPVVENRDPVPAATRVEVAAPPQAAPGTPKRRVKLDQELNGPNRLHRTNEVLVAGIDGVSDSILDWAIEAKIGHEVDESGQPIAKQDAQAEGAEEPADKMLSGSPTAGPQ